MQNVVRIVHFPEIIFSMNMYDGMITFEAGSILAQIVDPLREVVKGNSLEIVDVTSHKFIPGSAATK